MNSILHYKNKKISCHDSPLYTDIRKSIILKVVTLNLCINCIKNLKMTLFYKIKVSLV